MEQVIKTIIAQDLSGTQETSLLKGIAVVKTYQQLQGVSDIRSFLTPTGRVALFFPVGQTDASPGHWLAIWFNRKTNTIHHFDSYGFSPAAEIKYSSNPEVKSMLLNKLYQRAQQEGMKVVWNTTPYQKEGGGVNTCGRHVICRLRFHYLDEPAYEKLMLHQPSDPDSIVTMLTMLALDEDQQDVGKILADV